MFCAVENEHSSINAHSGYNIWVLGLVSSFVDLSRMVNFLFNMHFNRSLFTRRSIPIAANFSAVFIISVGTRSDILRDFNVRDL